MLKHPYRSVIPVAVDDLPERDDQREDESDAPSGKAEIHSPLIGLSGRLGPGIDHVRQRIVTGKYRMAQKDTKAYEHARERYGKDRI